jgi:ribosomal protein S18 acetylase RimI-like enzyme
MVTEKDPLAPVTSPSAKLAQVLAASTAAAATATVAINGTSTIPDTTVQAPSPPSRMIAAKKKVVQLVCGAPEADVDIGLPAATDEHLPSRITVAHAQLQVAADHADGEACIVYSVVVHRRCRRLGMGGIVMDALDRIARRADYSYIYLFTNDQQRFYESCGYSICKPISFLGASAKRISMEQLEGLEAMIGQRAASLGYEKQHCINSAATLTQTWLRKRLREEKPSVYSTDSEVTSSFMSHPLMACRSGSSCCNYWQSIDDNERTFHRIPDRLQIPYLYYSCNNRTPSFFFLHRLMLRYL